MGYDKNFGNYDYNSSESALSVTINKVYGWMALALGVSAFAAYYTATSEALLNLIFGNSFGMWGLIIAEFVLVIAMSAGMNKFSFSTLALLFGVYSVLNGMTLSVILLVYTMSSIVTAFVSTAATFGVMSLIGYTTKKNLASYGSYFLMALIGLVIASLVNMFLHNSMMDLIITYIGLFIFVGLTAYDTQKIKNQLQMGESYGVDTRKIGLMGAFNLYLDFINLFLYILRLLGSRRN